MREKDVKKDGGGEWRGLRRILPLVFQSDRLTVRVSAAELALFHTGAILSSPGFHPPATATWEHSGGDKCLFSVCGSMCSCTAVVSDNTFTNRPPLHPLRSLSVSTTVQSVRDLEANLLECVSRNFSALLGDIFVFFKSVFLLQPLLNVIGACTAIC